MAYDDERLSDYVDVAERIRLFAAKHPEGCLQPVDPSRPFWIETIGDRTFICYAASAFRHPGDLSPGIGLAWEPFPGKTPYTRDSELMNAETGAWGRAIVAALAADTKKIATREDIQNREPPKLITAEQTRVLKEELAAIEEASAESLVRIKAWWKQHYPPLPALSETQADEILDYLDKLKDE